MMRETALKTALIALLAGLALVAAIATIAEFGGETSELTEINGHSEGLDQTPGSR